MPAAPAQQETGFIEDHVCDCLEDYDPYALFDTCHANGIVGDHLILDGPVSLTGTTAGSIGAACREDLSAGTYAGHERGDDAAGVPGRVR